MSSSRAQQHELSVIRGAIEGSRPDFERLYHQYADKVRYVVARAAIRRGRRRDIDELNQEVWCRLLDNDRRLLRRYDHQRGPFATFIGMVAYQQALIVVKQAQRRTARVDGELDGELLVDEQSLRFAEELVRTQIYEKLIDRARAELEVRELELLRDLYLDQRTYQSVASRLGVTENAVYKRCERLKKKLASMAKEMLCVPSEASDSGARVRVALAMMITALVVQPSVAVGVRSIHPALECGSPSEQSTESLR